MQLLKAIARRGFSHLGLEITRKSPNPSAPPARPQSDGEVRPSSTEQIPWGPGYAEARDRFVGQALADPHLLTRFAEQRELPERYGIGFDERCVEYPWALTQLPHGCETVLDAGSVLNYRFILEHDLIKEKHLHVITLAPELHCFWEKGISYLFDDLRRIPTRDAYYDAIVCVSTLEHVGFDNSLFTQQHAEECRPDDFRIVMKEFSRVLKPGGSLLLTVPFGKRQEFGGFQQFDVNLLSQAIDGFGATSALVKNFYRYTTEGWKIAMMGECSESEYVQWVGRAFSGQAWPQPLFQEPDGAAAARAVACVKVTK